jgi:hypothetical protein
MQFFSSPSPPSFLPSCQNENLQHNNTHPIHLRSVNLIILIHAASQLRRPPIEQIKVQFPITGLELVVFEEEWIVQQRESIEDVETILLGENERVVDERV